MSDFLNEDELSQVSGGIKNADLPGVQAAMLAFYCASGSQLPPTNIAHPDGSIGTTGGGSYSNCSPA